MPKKIKDGGVKYLINYSTSIATSRAILEALFFPLSTVFAGILVFWTKQTSRGGGRTFNGSIPCFMFWFISHLVRIYKKDDQIHAEVFRTTPA